MAKYFEGSSTGNKYEVGKTYEMNGAGYKANSDGSFTKQGNIVATTDEGRVVYDTEGRGHTTRGSYGNPDVGWYESGGTSSASSTRGYNPGQATNVAGTSGSYNNSRAEEGQVRSSGMGGGLVPVANPSRSSAQSGARLAAAGQGVLIGAGRFMPWRGVDDPEQHFQIMGHQMVAAPTSSNAAMIEERWGDGEFLSPAWFANWGVSIDDYRHNLNVRTYGTENTYDRDHRAAVQKAAVEDIGASVINWAFDTVEGIRANEVAYQAAKARVQDAYDARDEILAEEVKRMEQRNQNGGYFWGTN